MDIKISLSIRRIYGSKHNFSIENKHDPKHMASKERNLRSKYDSFLKPLLLKTKIVPIDEEP